MSNRHLLILDGHGSHVGLETMQLAASMGLDIVTIPSHTSHALQPLDVNCFKPFKSAYKKERDTYMLISNLQSLTKQF